MADGGAIWVLGDWGQSQPWQRTNGVKMVKDKNDVWTGKLTLPKGTNFEIQVMKSTVSTTSGGVNKWSATRDKSTLNMTASYDFGEFTTNLVPNGDFEGGAVGWTPTDAIHEKDVAHGGSHVLAVASWTDDTAVVTSDTFVIPPNQSLRCAFYVRAWEHPGKKVTLSVKDVDTQSVVFEKTLQPSEIEKWIAVAGAFKSGDTPMRAQVVCNTHGYGVFSFDDISLVSV